jgi:hypothetical protein
MTRMLDLDKTCVQGCPKHGRWVVGAQFKPGAETRLIIIRCVVGELDAEVPATGKADHEHRLVDAWELDRPHWAAATDGLKTSGQFLAPVRAREDVHVAAESDHDLAVPYFGKFRTGRG